MLDSILIAPDNRFLTLSTYDFSLYGGQIPPALAFSPARPSEATPSADQPVGASAFPPEIPPPATFLAGETDVRSADAVTAVPAPLAAPSATLPPGNQPIPVAQSPSAFGTEPFVPQPFGSGSVAPSAVQPSLTQTVDPTAPSDPIPPVSNITAGIADSLTFTAIDTLGQVGQTVDALQGSVAAPLDPIIDASRALTEAVASPVSATIDTVVSPVLNDVVTPVIDATVDVGTSLLDAVTNPVLDGVVAPVVDGVVTPAIDAVVGSVGETVTTLVEDDLSELAGSDPVGGVATLVSLVSIGDVFDVGEGEAHETVTTPVPDLVDTLAADALPENPLLGDDDAADDGGLIPSPVDDPLGLI